MTKEERAKYQVAYDEKNSMFLHVRLKKDVGITFKRLCSDNGRSVNSVLAEFVKQYNRYQTERKKGKVEA